MKEINKQQKKEKIRGENARRNSDHGHNNTPPLNTDPFVQNAKEGASEDADTTTQ